MLIHKDYQIFKATSPDFTRPSLRYVMTAIDPSYDPEKAAQAALAALEVEKAALAALAALEAEAAAAQEPDQDVDQAADQEPAPVKLPAEQLPAWLVDHDIPGTAVATDGFILAVVPVMFKADDQPGLILPDVFIAAAKASRKNKGAPGDQVFIDLAKDHFQLVGLADGSWIPRFDSPGDQDLSFPDFGPIIPARIQPAAKADQPILMAGALQPSYLIRTIKAIGCQAAVDGPGSKAVEGSSRIVYGRADKHGLQIEPYVIEPTSHDLSQPYLAPFGVIMPMHSDNQDPTNYWHQPGK